MLINRFCLLTNRYNIRAYSLLSSPCFLLVYKKYTTLKYFTIDVNLENFLFEVQIGDAIDVSFVAQHEFSAEETFPIAL